MEGLEVIDIIGVKENLLDERWLFNNIPWSNHDGKYARVILDKPTDLYYIQLNGFDVYYGALNLRNIFSINNNQSSSRQLFIGLTGFLNISTDGNDVPQIANLSVPTYSSYPNSGIPSQYVNHSGSPSPYDVNVLEWSSTDMSRTGFLISIAKGYLSGDFYGVYHVRYSSIVVSGAPSTNYITGNSNTFSF